MLWIWFESSGVHHTQGDTMKHEFLSRDELTKMVEVWKKQNPKSEHYKHYKERLENYDRNNKDRYSPRTEET